MGTLTCEDACGPVSRRRSARYHLACSRRQPRHAAGTHHSCLRNHGGAAMTGCPCGSSEADAWPVPRGPRTARSSASSPVMAGSTLLGPVWPAALVATPSRFAWPDPRGSRLRRARRARVAPSRARARRVWHRPDYDLSRRSPDARRTTSRPTCPRAAARAARSGAEATAPCWRTSQSPCPSRYGATSASSSAGSSVMG